MRDGALVGHYAGSYALVHSSPSGMMTRSMNPWAPTSPTWYDFGEGEMARQADSLVDAVVEYLDELDIGELEGRLPAVLRVACCIDDCDDYCGEATDCAAEAEHAIRRYATAFVPLRPLLVRLGWDSDEELMDSIEAS